MFEGTEPAQDTFSVVGFPVRQPQNFGRRVEMEICLTHENN